MAGILKLIEGAAMMAGGIAIDVFAPGAAWVGNMLIAAGAGQVISGVGSMVQGNPMKGFATTTRNPIAPWRVCYGRCRTGGTLVYMHQWGDKNQVLDLVIVLAAHPSQAVEELLFDQQRIQIDPSGIPTSARAGYSIPAPCAGSGTSFTPVQQTINASRIVRANDVVTVTLPQDIPYLTESDQVTVESVPGDATLNGIFQVAEIVSRVPSGGTNILTFTYLCGGLPADVVSAGHVKTRWADYGRDVYMEVLLGDQALGETFLGMTAGTPWQGTGKLCTPASPQQAGGTPAPNPWTRYCSLQGKTAVFLRLKYSTNFPAGLPQISFHLRGKKDIYDPRTAGYGYTENAALCIADLLNQGDLSDGRRRFPWGFGAAYGTEIPTAELAAEADICDEAVALARGGTEPRYTCNGQFELSMRRGEILQNLLTSCAGRLTYQGGQFRIHAAAWRGAGSPPVAVDLTAIAAGPYRWRSTVSIRDLFNGAKGTYISPANKWQSTDFPYYAQDGRHGYGGPSPDGGDINLAGDGGERRWLELHLPYTISASTAQRIAKIELLRRRHGGTGTFPLTMAGYQFAALDVFQAWVGFLGFVGKYLEVTAVRFRADQQSEGGREIAVLGTEIDVQETDSSVYAWADEEELSAQGYVQTTMPGGTLIESTPLPWSPGYVSPLAGDAVGGPASFGVRPVYGVDAQGNGTAAIEIQGTPPINALDRGIASPQFTCTGSSTGGTIPAGTYVVGLTAHDSGAANHKATAYHGLAVVEIPVTSPPSTGSIAVEIDWGSGDDGGALYVGLWTADGYVFHWQQDVAPGAATATITGFRQDTPGGPDPLFDHFGVQWQAVIHAGAWAEQVRAVTATTVTVAGAGMASNRWAGKVLSLLAKFDGTAPVVLNMPVASSTASAGAPAEFTLTIGPNVYGVQLPDLTTLLAVGDLVVLRLQATFTANGFSDADIANPYYPGGATAVEGGHVAVVLTGADKGDVQTIAGVSVDGSGRYTVFELADGWKVTPAAGDLVIVCAPAAPEWPGKTMAVRNNSLSGAMIAPAVENLALQAWLFLVRTKDAGGACGPDYLAPMREIFMFGAAVASATPAAPAILAATAGVVADSQVGLTPYFALGGTITVDDGHVNWAWTKRLIIKEKGPDGASNIDTLLTLDAPFTVVGHQVTWTAAPQPRDTVAHNWRLEFYAENPDGALTGPYVLDPVAVSAAAGPLVPPANIATLVLAEVGSRSSDAVQVTHTTFRVSGTLTANRGQQYITVWFSFDNGASWRWVNWYSASGTTYSFDIDWTVNYDFPSGCTMKAAVIVGGVPRTATLPSGATILTTGIAVPGLGAVSVSAVTGAEVSTPVRYWQNVSGSVQWWGLDYIRLTILQAVGVYANLWRIQLYVRKCNAAGTVAAPDREGDWRPVLDAVPFPGANRIITWPIDFWDVPEAGLYNYYQFKVMGELHDGTGVVDLQCWNGDTTTASTPFQVTSQGATFNTAFVDPTTVGRGLTANPTTGQLENGIETMGSILTDPSFEQLPAGTTYSFSGGQITPAPPGGGWAMTLGGSATVEIRSDGTAKHGNQYIRCTGQGAGVQERATVYPSRVYCLSIWVRSSNTAGGSHQGFVSFRWADKDGNALSPDYYPESGYLANWTQLWAEVTAPANAAYLYVNVQNSFSEPAGGYWDFDYVQIFEYTDYTTPGGQRVTMAPTVQSIGGNSGTSPMTLTAAADSSLLTFTRNGFTIVAPDGSAITISVSNGNVSITLASGGKSVVLTAIGGTIAGLQTSGSNVLSFTDQGITPLYPNVGQTTTVNFPKTSGTMVFKNGSLTQVT